MNYGYAKWFIEGRYISEIYDYCMLCVIEYTVRCVLIVADFLTV